MVRKPIKVLFDAVPLSQERPTGVGRTEAGLIAALARNYPDDLELVGHYFDFLGRMKRKGAKGILVEAPNIRYRRTVLLPGKVFNMLRRMKLAVPYELLVKERGSFHLFPNFLGWPSLFKTPSAPYIHDTTYIDTPEYVRGPNLFDLRTLMPGIVKRSSFIITNTEDSARSIKRVYPWYDNPCVVAHIPLVNTVRIAEDQANNIIQKMGIKKPFLLFHATLEPRKNLPNLVAAFIASSDINSKYTLAISGGKGWKDAEIMETVKKAQQEGFDIVRLGYVSDEERAALFMRAKLYIIPSFYEGFGMQILEAFFYRTPVLASDIPVLKEVGGEACYYAGTSPEELAKALGDIVENESVLQNLVRLGDERLKHFDWDIIVKDVYGAIKKSVQ